MFGSLLTVVACLTSINPKQARFVAEIPAGTSTELHELVRAVSSATAASRWDDASAIAAKLPSRKMRVLWEDSVLTPNLRDYLEISRSTAMTDLKFRIPGLAPKFGNEGAITIRYQHIKATKIAFNTEPNKPWIEFDFPLERTSPERSAIGADSSNDVTFAVLRALGVAPNSQNKTVMGRDDASPPATLAYAFSETNVARSACDFADKVRAAVASHQSVILSEAKMEVNTRNIDLGSVMQGDTTDFQFTVKNSGDAPLQVYIRPDCGCIVADKDVKVKPGETVVVNGSIETMEYTGNIAKAITLITNDSVHPFSDVFLKLDVQQRYRFIYPSNRMLFVDGPTVTGDVYVLFGSGIATTVSNVVVNGANGKATAERWRGNVLDPETGTEIKNAFGYKIHAEILPPPVPGRVSVNLLLRTNDEHYKQLTATLSLQKGIIALPDTANFGDVSNIRRELIVLISQPGRAFRINGVASDSKFVTAKIEPIKNRDEFRLILNYTGKAPIGPLKAKVSLMTSDAKQPVLVIPVRGIVQ